MFCFPFPSFVEIRLCPDCHYFYTSLYVLYVKIKFMHTHVPTRFILLDVQFLSHGYISKYRKYNTSFEEVFTRNLTFIILWWLQVECFVYNIQIIDVPICPTRYPPLCLLLRTGDRISPRVSRVLCLWACGCLQSYLSPLKTIFRFSVFTLLFSSMVFLSNNFNN